MLPENHSFFVRGDDGQEYGPVDLDELRDWVQENRAGLGTDVRRDEPGASWSPWQNYPELVALLAEVHGTSPVPGQPGLVMAPLGRRIAAFGIDLVLITIPMLIVCYTLALAFMPDWFIHDVVSGSQHPFNPPDLPLNANLVVDLIYDSMLTLYFGGFVGAHGLTPAKAMLGLRVVDQSGQKPGLLRAFLRALALIFSMNLLFLPLTYAFFNPQRRALHDYIAGTYVVKA
jgi:uncharacterized RDD family membrane protein YckC